MKRIAIFNQNRNFFGTQILQIPFLQYLAKTYPDAKRVIYTSNPLSQMFSSLDLVDEVIEMQGYGKLWKQLRLYRPDLIFCFRHHSDLLNLLLSTFRSSTRIGFSSWVTQSFFDHDIKKNKKRYRPEHYLEFLEPLGINSSEYTQLFTSLHDVSKGEKPAGETRFVIMPGAGRAFKLWGLGNFFNITLQLQERFPDAQFHFVLGPGEEALKDEIEMQGNERYAVEYNRSIPELVALLTQSDLVIAHDCGPSHISHMCGARHLGLVSDEKEDAQAILAEWFPIRDQATALVSQPGESMSTLAVDTVYQEAIALMEI